MRKPYPTRFGFPTAELMHAMFAQIFAAKGIMPQRQRLESSWQQACLQDVSRRLRNRDGASLPIGCRKPKHWENRSVCDGRAGARVICLFKYFFGECAKYWQSFRLDLSNIGGEFFRLGWVLCLDRMIGKANRMDPGISCPCNKFWIADD